MDKQDDARRTVRYTHGNLFVVAQRPGFWSLISKPRRVDWMDFNRLGMAFECDAKFKAGAPLMLHLDIRDTEHVTASNIVASIRNVGRRSRRYRYGVEFDFLANDHMNSAAVRESLAEIERILLNIFKRLEIPPA